MQTTCTQCGLKVRQRKTADGLRVDVIDTAGREAYKYLVPPDERMESTTVRTHPCGDLACQRALVVEKGKAGIA